MKPLVIIANWKSHKTSAEALSWWQVFSEKHQPDTTIIILAVPYTLLPILAPVVSTRPDVFLAAQDMSPFDESAHTGEVAGQQIKEFAKYVLIGHSEVRKETGETVDIRKQKIMQAQASGLTPFVFYGGTDDTLLQSPFLVYEPPSAISPNPPETPEDVFHMTEKMHESMPDAKILYGGNVTPENVKSYVTLPLVEVVVIGRASLDPLEFLELIAHAQ